jgi:hypothetical protein
MSVHYPDTLILDLGHPIGDYTRSVRDLGQEMDTDPQSMISWLLCYISSRQDADAQLQNAVCDIASSDQDVNPDTMSRFLEAADELGSAIVDQMTQCGVFSPVDGEFPYQFSKLIGGRTAVFTKS